jgi:hypothetical protein
MKNVRIVGLESDMGVPEYEAGVIVTTLQLSSLQVMLCT